MAPEKIAALVERMRPVIADVIGMPVTTKSASTDCNIPLSLGIPALCMGVYFGGGSHTREEWIRKDSLAFGLEAAIRTAYTLMEDKP
jgi:di/tripeptidase